MFASKGYFSFLLFTLLIAFPVSAQELSDDDYQAIAEELECSAVGKPKCWCFTGWYDYHNRKPVWRSNTMRSKQRCDKWSKATGMPCEWQECAPTYDPNATDDILGQLG